MVFLYQDESCLFWSSMRGKEESSMSGACNKAKDGLIVT